MTKKLILLLAVVLLLALLGIRMLGRTGVPLPTAPPLPEVTGIIEPTPAPTPEPSPPPTASPEPTPDPIPEPTPETTLAHPELDTSSWEYILANPEHDIGNYRPELAALENGHFFDSRAVDALKEFIAAGRDAGLSVVINSSYRDYDTQKYLYDRKVAQYNGDTATAATIVAPPGTSEHQTALCCDIADQFYSTKDQSLENTETYKWMYAHCAEYGFILRYPKDKQDITGIIYEPWHFRYVGKEAAAFIMENGLCLEEFLALYE